MSDDRLALLLRVSREAGHLLRDFFGKKIDVKFKSGQLDVVTAADEAAERLIIDRITALYPEDAILAEESGARSGQSGVQWIIDPLDGTTNFSHGFPQFSVSMAFARGQEVLAGVVFDPIKDEFFHAVAGQGAWLNGEPIQVGSRDALGLALGVTGFSYDRRERMDELLERTRRILMHCHGLRRLGSAALDLAYVACGRFDVFLEDGLNAWDIAAGQLLVSEAGGCVSLLNGNPLDLHAGQILATNKQLQPQALEHLTHT